MTLPYTKVKNEVVTRLVYLDRGLQLQLESKYEYYDVGTRE